MPRGADRGSQQRVSLGGSRGMGGRHLRAEIKTIRRKSLCYLGLRKVDKICVVELVDRASFVGIFGALWEEMEVLRYPTFASTVTRNSCC